MISVNCLLFNTMIVDKVNQHNKALSKIICVCTYMHEKGRNNTIIVGCN